jgi:hypothetical protein
VHCRPPGADHAHRDVTKMQPGQQLMCRGLFVSCLLDCLEHKSPSVHVSGRVPGLAAAHPFPASAAPALDSCMPSCL